MFSEEDFQAYFSALEEKVRALMIVSTNFANEIADRALRSKLDVMIADDLELLRFLRENKKKFIHGK